MAKRRIAFLGHRFGRLLVIGPGPKGAHTKWLCRCDCGTEKHVRGSHMTSGLIRSCGCLRSEVSRKLNRSNGMSSGYGLGRGHGGAFASWRAMMRRCLAPQAPDYPRYGARGITISARWRLFGNFFEDMGDRPEGLTLDRINPRGNYEPGNCRWATRLVQANNRISGKYITHLGQTKNLKEWARYYGIVYPTFVQRMNRKGMSFQQAVKLALEK